MTTSRTPTVREAVNSGSPGVMASALQNIQLGTVLSKIKVVFAGLSSSAAQDITTAAAKAAGTITGITLQTGENLPPIGQVVSCRIVTGGTAGAVVITDASGTPVVVGATGNAATPGVATLSDDGKTITFVAAVTAFTLVYYPAPSGGMTDTQPQAAP